MPLNDEQYSITLGLKNEVEIWIKKEGSAKSTLAAAVVVIDLISLKGFFSETDLFTPGGQVSGSRGKSLILTLEKYGLRSMLDEHGGEEFLKDGATTRSTKKFERLANDTLKWGIAIGNWSQEERNEAVRIILEPIIIEMENYFKRQRIKLRPNLSDAPAKWIEQLLYVSTKRSQGRVEQHLVGAKLQKRLPLGEITQHAAFAGDVQTDRDGDFVIGKAVIHVTAAPAAALIRKCEENLRKGLHPILLVPRDAVERAKGLAAYQKIEDRVSFIAIEDFIATNIIEIASETHKEFYEVLKEIIDIYNQRIVMSELDLSLRIELE